MKRVVLLAIPILLVFWSCSENSLFLGAQDEPAQVEVHTFDSGTLVEPGAEVPIAISRDAVYTGDESTLDRLVVEVLDHEGTLLAERTYESVDEASDLPPVELPRLAGGLYRLRTAYYDGSELVVEETVSFFVATGTYRIVGLTSYPASSYPEADGLLRISLDIPLDADPFLAWWINDEVVESGYLSESGSTLAVLAPEAQGVFPVRVDLYPHLPEAVDFRSVAPSVTYAAELYVSDSPAPARTDLVPAESYFALYHLRGSLRDDGVRTRWFPSRDFTATAFGTPELTARSDLFGYALDGSSGFRMGASVWPAYRGVLSPVSISLRLLPDALDATTVLVSTSLVSAELVAVLVDEEGRIGARLGEPGSEFWSAVPMVSVGEPAMVTVSIVPGAESGRVSFYSGGQLVSALDVAGIVLPATQASLDPGADRWSLIEGTTVLGAERDGFVGVIDEFGVFFRDSENQPAANTTLFRDSMRAAYGERLVYVASFEGDDETERLELGDRSFLADGALVLEPSASIVFPEFAFEDEELIVRIDLTVSARAELLLTGAADDEPVVSIELEPADAPTSIELRLTHGDESLSVVYDDEVVARTQTDGFTGVRLAISTAPAPETDEAVRIHSIVAVRDRARIPSRLFQVSDE